MIYRYENNSANRRAHRVDWSNSCVSKAQPFIFPTRIDISKTIDDFQTDSTWIIIYQKSYPISLTSLGCPFIGTLAQLNLQRQILQRRRQSQLGAAAKGTEVAGSQGRDADALALSGGPRRPFQKASQGQNAKKLPEKARVTVPNVTKQVPCSSGVKGFNAFEIPYIFWKPKPYEVLPRMRGTHLQRTIC